VKRMLWRFFKSLLFMATGVYLFTALVFEEGGFGFFLALKPHPTMSIMYGGGEEGAWQRENPQLPLPWWIKGDYRVLLTDDWEQGIPLWTRAYESGYVITLITWFMVFIVISGRTAIHILRVRRSGTAQPRQDVDKQ